MFPTAIAISPARLCEQFSSAGWMMKSLCERQIESIIEDTPALVCTRTECFFGIWTKSWTPKEVSMTHLRRRMQEDLRPTYLSSLQYQQSSNVNS